MLLRISSVTILFFFFGVIATPTFAQTYKTDLKTLSTKSEIVVIGKVVDQKSQWNSDRSGIFTEATISVDEHIKGNNSHNQIIVRYLGGEVGEVGELYSHVPTFKKDEEVLLFATKDKEGPFFRVYAGVDGKMTVYTDQNTGEKVTATNRNLASIKNEIRNYIRTE